MAQACLIVVTGIMAAGKSTVAQALAKRFPRSATVRGDWYRRAIVQGRHDMSPDPTAGAPNPTEVAGREQQQSKLGYRTFTPEQLDAVLRTDPPRLGCWLDSTGLTVDEVLANLDKAAVID